MTGTKAGLVGLVALLAGALALFGSELLLGARDYGAHAARDACAARAPFRGGGLDGTIQQIALSGLDGAACKLGTTREELVLSILPSEHRRIRWTRQRVETAVRAGLERSIADAEAQGRIGAPTADVLRAIVERAPLDWLVQGGSVLQGIF